MNRKQLALLFVSNTIILSVGSGLGGLMPVYATAELGAEPGAVGLFMSFAFLGLATGTVFAGWLSDRFQHRTAIFVAATLLDCLALWLMGRVATFAQLAVVVALDWFVGGVALTLLTILAGLYAEPSERGRVFGLLSLTGGLGPLLGVWAGAVVDWRGYRAMFTVAALISLCNPLAGLLLEDRGVARDERQGVVAARWAGLGGSFLLLLVGRLAVTTAQFVGILSRALLMEELGFGGVAISSVGAVGGAVSVGLALLAGWLSDRIGRKWPLAICYVGGAVGLIVLAMATTLVHFWIVAILLSLAGSVAAGIGSALVTDLVGQESLGKGLSWFSTMGWIGGILGYAGTGYAIQYAGLVPTLALGALVPVAAVVLLIPIRVARPEEWMGEVEK